MNEFERRQAEKIRSIYGTTPTEQGHPLEGVLDFEKGGKRAQVGDIRVWDGVKYVKHQDGWVYLKKNGSHGIERPGGKREPAESHHIEHHSKHIGGDKITDLQNDLLKQYWSGPGNYEEDSNFLHYIREHDTDGDLKNLSGDTIRKWFNENEKAGKEREKESRPSLEGVLSEFKGGVVKKVKDTEFVIQKKDNPQNRVIVTENKDGKVNIHIGSGSIENPSRAGNGIWYNYGDRTHDHDSLRDVLSKYGISKESTSTETKPVKEVPKKEKNISELSSESVEGDIRSLLKPGMKITDLHLSRDNTYFDTYIQTPDRGPRTDHGGGVDGDEWMDDYQLESVSKPYREKYKPFMESLKTNLEKKYKDVDVYFDYGEKGHVGIQVSGKKK